MADRDGKPTLHHMDNSQSQRILWLLEELEIPYNLELHYRVKTGPRKGRAPPELAALHPLGKAPQLVTASGRIIAESSAIAAYLLATYDTARRFHGGTDKASNDADADADHNGGTSGDGDGPQPPPPSSSTPTTITNDYLRDESLTSFAGASLGPILILKLLLDIAVAQSPFFIRPLVRALTGAIDRAFPGPELRAMLGYLEAELGEQAYFMGEDAPGRADFMLSFPLDMVAHNGWADFGSKGGGSGGGYEKLGRWRERCQGREGWKRALSKGNGYWMGAF